MMEAVRTSETSVDNHFTRQYNPEDSSEHQTWLPWNINNPNPQFSKAHLTTFNLSNFKIIEAVELKIIASWPP
jgi:hypothetical protein